MDWEDHYRAQLPEYLDGNGDLAPPWARFPNQDNYSIFWRMGSGEDWMLMWRVFLDGLAPDFATRLAYLRRHPPAPAAWSCWIEHTLEPHPEGTLKQDSPESLSRLSELGLIVPDSGS